MCAANVNVTLDLSSMTTPPVVAPKDSVLRAFVGRNLFEAHTALDEFTE
jgi:hypothetical protein